MSDTIKTTVFRIVLLLFVLSDLLSGGKMKNVELVVLNEISPQTETIELQMTNHTGRYIDKDRLFHLEKREGDQWISVPWYEPIEETSSHMAPGHVSTQSIPIVRMFERYLEPGDYRIFKIYHPMNMALPEYTCYAYFTVQSVE